MLQEIIKFDENNALKNSSYVKEELQDEYYEDNKVSVSETTINICNTELDEYLKYEEIGKYEMLNNIKADLLVSSKVNDTVSNNTKIDEISSVDIQIEFCNGLSFCDHCHEVYQDYCTKCRMLVHILNKRPSHSTYKRVRELPKCMLETRESLGHLGIFSLNVIPENVRFGPFTGLNCTRLSLKIKGGSFEVSDDQLEHLNWMQYINPARNIYEQNLFPIQNRGKLYYYSTRRIQEGEELLVYFGEEYIASLCKNVKMDFLPIANEDVENVFACTFCCLGFSLKEYLAEHKAVCHSEIKEMFSVEELVQCPFCEIYLDAKEYLKHHMDYCYETNARYYALPSEEDKLGAERRSSIRSKPKRWKRGMYKCTQCKFRTVYSADFRHHTNKHYEVKMYKCGICDRRYKTRGFLKMHVEKNHAENEGSDVKKYSKCDYLKTNIKNIKGRFTHSHDDKKHCQSSKYKFQTRD